MKNAWSDPKIVAITPFILRYNAAPFEQFSWMVNGQPLEHYNSYQAMLKTKGEPVKDDKAHIVDTFLPETLNTKANYRVGFRLLNAGQSIWDKDTFKVEIIDAQGLVESISEISTVEPGETIKIWFELVVPSEVKTNSLQMKINLEGKPIMDDVIYTFDSVERMGILQPLRLWLERWFYEKDFIGSQDGIIA